MKSNIRDYLLISALICLATWINNCSFHKEDSIKLLNPVDKELAIIDASHLERFSLNQWDKDGYGGLCYNLMRAGYMPLISTSGITYNISSSKLLVLIAPAKPFDKAEMQILEQYVRNGGYILIACGWEESHGSQKLLKKFGLSVENIPLGKIGPDQNVEKLSFTKAWALECEGNICDILCEVWDRPTIVLKSIGNGGVILMGDSGFFLNKNLEGMESYNHHNILFLKEMMEKYIKSM